jgi:DNA topoisomerase I
MRVKNKELKQRRHRKEQTIKAAIREAKKGGADKPEKKAAAPAAEKPAVAKKPAPKKTETAEKKPAAKKPAAKKAEPEAAAE